MSNISEATTVTITEGTNISVSVSPDGKSAVMELQGVLWKVPVNGGIAKRITGNYVDPSYPEWSPDGEKIVFQSYLTGNFHIYMMNPDGTNMKQLTHGPYDHREPTFSSNGTKVAFSSDRGGTGSYDIWVLDLMTNELKQWTNTLTEVYQPTWSPSGDEIAYVNNDPFLIEDMIQAVDEDGNIRTLIHGKGTVFSPSWSPDGSRITYFLLDSGLMMTDLSKDHIPSQLIDDSDVFPFPVEWLSADEIVYTADGHIQSRNLTKSRAVTIPFKVEIEVEKRDYKYKEHDFDSVNPRPVMGIVAPKISPDGKQVAFVALNDLWLWEIGDEDPRPLTNDGHMALDPAWSPDGKKLAYSSDKAGTQNIYILDLETGKEQQLTFISSGAEVAAAWSPNGTQIAFQDQTGETYTVDVETKEIDQVIPSLNLPGTPTWGPDSKTIALTSLETTTNRFREGTNQILTFDLKTGSHYYEEPIKFLSLSNRKNSGPVWSPDGKNMVFIIESQLWIMPVDENGKSIGEPFKITEEIADSPSWSGDSKTLLYLSKGEFKRVSLEDRNSETLPFQMRWTPKQPSGTKIIHAGKLWDGVNEDIKENVDIIIEGNRIVDITPHGKHDYAGEFIDASKLTVIPGLWDAHIHQQLFHEFYGARQGRQLLSFGITNTMSMGDFAYRAIEDREATYAGTRVGPRFFASSELIDGSRIYYSPLRPTTSIEAVERELERGKALDVDILKTYVRLPFDHQNVVITFAHDIGVPTFSHYFYPPMLFGQDGIAHISGTQRQVFSRTKTQGGKSYEDVIQLAGRSNMSVTSTMFARDELESYKRIEKDPRVKKLYTPWQYAALIQPPKEPPFPVDLAKDVAILKDILDAGGVVLNGTDAPLMDIGIGTHLELSAMVRYGMTPYEALHTATIEPAKIMGVEDDLGSIERGKLADIVFVNGNPHKKIEEAANVEMVMKNGELFTIDELIAPYK